jgi:hypothetical protein
MTKGDDMTSTQTILTYPGARKRGAGQVAMILVMCLCTQAYACPSTATIEKWTGIVLNAVATVGPMISPIIGAIAGLAGKVLTAAQVAAINGDLAKGQTDLTAIQGILVAVVGTPDQTTLGKLNALETTLSTELNAALLQANGISDPAAQQQIIAEVNVLIATAQKIESLIPTTVVAGKFEFRHPLTPAQVKVLAAQLTPSAIKASFNAAIVPTGNAAVDNAFATIRAK